jgi:hypothetical protein
LDNQSTVDVFFNRDLLTNIRTDTGSMDIHCKAGIASTNLIGDLAGYGTVWYHPKGIANTLSLSRVKDHGCRVTYDSHDGNRFTVHKKDGSTRIFKESHRGLFYMDTADNGIQALDNNNGATVMVNTVAHNRDGYTNCAYSRALTARSIQKKIGRPSTQEYIKIVENNLLPNCPVTRDDIMAAKQIFGPDLGSLKGKTVHRKGEHVEYAAVPIPAIIMAQYRNVIIGADIMVVNKLAFLVTISRNIKFSTAELIPDQKDKTLISAVRKVRGLYLKRGFRIESLKDGRAI